MCDTVAIIRSGKLVVVAGRDELLERYAVSAVELECEHQHLPFPEPFVGALQSLPWVAAVNVDQNILRVTVTDVEQGKAALLPLISEYGLILNRYEWVRPTLEEIFLKISA